MKSGHLLVVLLASLFAAVSSRPGDDTYGDKWDEVDVDAILGNARLRKSYISCFLANSDAHCTPDGKELKKILPEALVTGCEKCNEKQKNAVKKVVKTISGDFPDDWTKLRTKWDPENIYYEKYKDMFTD